MSIRMFGLKIAALVLFSCLSLTSTAQINVVPVNGGTGSLVSIPIPGGSGLSVTVGTGSAAIPLQDIRSNPSAVNITTGDDDLTHVPLGFDFPFYGRVFNNSWAMTNGLVTFQDPWQSGLGGACCEGVDLRTTTSSAYNYTIFGMHSDLYSWNGQNQYYLRGNNEMTYGWYNTSQCCSGQGGNSFEIKINSLGLVDTRIAGAMISGNRVTSGMAGNLANGEYYQAYHGSGLNIIPGSANIFSWQALNGTGAVDMCTINPLSSPSCPGYQTAYTTQQCIISALYDPSCPGYAAAYSSQQCSVNPLFSTICPGYQQAYRNQQCSLDPLYSTSCPGYQQAYQTQQCSLNTLYSTSCPGYAAAYLDQQCSLDALYSTTCSGYSQAYQNQQCGLNPLYNSTCPGYDVAYKAQQCTASALYATDCPGYAQAYFDQQCSLNPLYNNQCPGYSQAYATKILLEQQSVVTTAATVVAVNETAPSAAPVSDGSSSVAIAVIADPIVNQAVTSTATSTSPAAAATATVSLVPAPAPAAAPVVAERKQEEQKTDKKTEEKADNKPEAAGATAQAQSNEKSDKPAAPTARQALAERRQEAARAKAVESGKNLANEMGKAADMEAQKAVQNVVIQAMGFTPGFDTYNKTMIPDTTFYKPFTVYKGQVNVDNKAISRRLMTGSDRTHEEMIESQYNKEK